jgi:hypothetical protein
VLDLDKALDRIGGIDHIAKVSKLSLSNRIQVSEMGGPEMQES